MGEAAGVVQVDVGCPLNHIQVLRGSSIAGRVLSIAGEGYGLGKHSVRRKGKNAAKQTRDKEAEAVLGQDMGSPNRH